MLLVIQRRAEIALRSLQAVERKQIDRALTELLATDRPMLRENPKFRALNSDGTEKKLFVYKGSPKLRLVVSFSDNTWIVQDIVDHDRLDHLVKQGGQK